MPRKKETPYQFLVGYCSTAALDEVRRLVETAQTILDARLRASGVQTTRSHRKKKPIEADSKQESLL